MSTLSRDEPATQLPMLLTPAQAFAQLGVSKPTGFALLKSGAIESVLIGPRTRRIPRDALIAYVERLRATA